MIQGKSSLHTGTSNALLTWIKSRELFFAVSDFCIVLRFVTLMQ